MELLQQNIIKESHNIEIKASSLILDNSISIGKKMVYPFIFEDKDNNNKYIYYRDDTPNKLINFETTRRYMINDINDVSDDINYSLNIYYATHNFRLFNIKNNVLAFAGKVESYYNIYLYDSLYKNCDVLEYNKKKCIKYFTTHCENKYEVNNDIMGTHIPMPTKYCPFYANGIYIFKFDDINKNIFTEYHKLPVINGIHEGRHDGFYGNVNKNNYIKVNNGVYENSSSFVNIELAKDGITVFDSSTSILYNENNKKYYLYQRANLAAGSRYIQYCTSNNLINWSPFNLLKIYPEKNYAITNLYYNNMININGINNYIGIIPYTPNKCDQDLELYYSNDCENWHLIGVIHKHKYYEYFMVLGEPILKDNKYYFYMSNSSKSMLESYYIEKNRFSYATVIDKNEISKILFKKMQFSDNFIKINFETFENGYLKMQLKDKNNNIINGYSFNDFNIIGENMNKFEYNVSWKNMEFILKEDVYVEIEGMNFNLYSINCVKIID